MIKERAEAIIELLTLDRLARDCPEIENHHDRYSLNAEYGCRWEEYIIDYGGEGADWAKGKVLEWLLEGEADKQVLEWLGHEHAEIERQLREQELQKRLHRFIDAINGLAREINGKRNACPTCKKIMQWHNDPIGGYLCDDCDEAILSKALSTGGFHDE